MAKQERRINDRGPEGRRLDIKTVLMIVALLANVGAVVWKGGQISNQFDSLLVTVSAMTVQMSSVLDNQSEARTERTVHAERITNLTGRVNKHDTRLDRIEQSPSIREWKR